MAKRYSISAEQANEIMLYRKKNKNKSVDRRLKALEMRAAGKKTAEIVIACEYHPAYVSKLVSIYCNHGIEAIVENHYAGNHRNMSFEEEKELLKQFDDAAEQGQVIAVEDIQRAYEEKIGRSIEKSHGHIYQLLKRHNFRKVMPRSKHPNKASAEAIEASKKLTMKSTKQM
jgi:hypothetical protein